MEVWGMDAKLAASIIVAVAYLVIFTERVNRAIVALLGASVMLLAGIMSQKQALEGIDFNTLALLIGMMIVVAITEKSGLFQFVAVWSAKKVHASPRGLLVVLAAVTAFFSAFLDNVTTVLLIVPVTLQITDKLKINPYPYLLIEIFASNIGGTATLIGDPPNILIGSALELGFMDFLKVLTPVVVITMAVLIALFDLVWKKQLVTDKRKRVLVMRMNEFACIKDKALLIKSVSVLALVIVTFIFAHELFLDNGTVALTGASLLLLLYTFSFCGHEREDKVEQIFGMVDWTTIFFFIGLFVMVYGLDVTGVLSWLGKEFLVLTNGSVNLMMYLILWVSAIFSSVIDNIPFVATMIPLLQTVEEGVGGREAMMPVWWALSLGSCFGGNGTLIGASANVVVAGIAARNKVPLSFARFLLWSIPVMLVSVLIANIFLYLEFIL